MKLNRIISLFLIFATHTALADNRLSKEMLEAARATASADAKLSTTELSKLLENEQRLEGSPQVIVTLDHDTANDERPTVNP